MDLLGGIFLLFILIIQRAKQYGIQLFISIPFNCYTTTHFFLFFKPKYSRETLEHFFLLFQMSATFYLNLDINLWTCELREKALKSLLLSSSLLHHVARRTSTFRFVKKQILVNNF